MKDGWEWDDGMPWGTFNDWESGQPGGEGGWTFSQQNCALRWHGRWHDAPCTGVNKYVCQKKCAGIFRQHAASIYGFVRQFRFVSQKKI